MVSATKACSIKHGPRCELAPAEGNKYYVLCRISGMPFLRGPLSFSHFRIRSEHFIPFPPLFGASNSFKTSMLLKLEIETTAWNLIDTIVPFFVSIYC